MKEWYAVQTKPNREFWASTALESTIGVQTYLPSLRIKPINPRAHKIRPFFPGYLFACADLEQVGLSALQWAPGVAHVVSCEARPIAIPDHVIEEIRSRVTTVQQEEPFGVGQFRHGDHVRIKEGPLKDLEGMFDIRLGAQTRVRILVEFLGRLTATEVDVRHLEKLSPRTVPS